MSRMRSSSLVLSVLNVILDTRDLGRLVPSSESPVTGRVCVSCNRHGEFTSHVLEINTNGLTCSSMDLSTLCRRIY